MKEPNSGLSQRIKNKMLTKQQKQDWINALRSGRYKQGKGVLCINDDLLKEKKYCCLGVLCDLNGIKFYPHPEKKKNAPFYIKDSFGDFAEYSFPVEDLLLDEAAELATMNDRGVSFNDIADWIERNIKTLD